MELKFHNRNFLVSSSVMCAMLKKADLENNGYQKEVITKVVEEPGSNISNFQACCKISLLSVVIRLRVLLLLDLVNRVLLSCRLCFNCVLMIIVVLILQILLRPKGSLANW